MKFHRCNFACPSINFLEYGPRIVDWFEWLMSQGLQEAYLVPQFSFFVQPPVPSKGDVIYNTKNTMWSAFEDLGLVKVEALFERKLLLDEEDKRALRKKLRRERLNPGEGHLCRIDVLENIPEHFESLFADLSTMYIVENIAEEL